MIKRLTQKEKELGVSLPFALKELFVYSGKITNYDFYSYSPSDLEDVGLEHLRVSAIADIFYLISGGCTISLEDMSTFDNNQKLHFIYRNDFQPFEVAIKLTGNDDPSVYINEGYEKYDEYYMFKLFNKLSDWIYHIVFKLVTMPYKTEVSHSGDLSEEKLANFAKKFLRFSKFDCLDLGDHREFPGYPVALHEYLFIDSKSYVTIWKRLDVKTKVLKCIFKIQAKDSRSFKKAKEKVGIEFPFLTSL